MSNKIVVESMFVGTAGQYQSQFARTNISNLTTAERTLLATSTRGGDAATSSNITRSGVALVNLEAEAGADVQIPEGWMAPRSVFDLTILMIDDPTSNQPTSRFGLSGYTDKPMFLPNGEIDMTTNVMFNYTTAQVWRTLSSHEDGGYWMVTDSDNVLCPTVMFRDGEEDTGAGRFMNPGSNVFFGRPADVFGRAQLNSMRSADSITDTQSSSGVTFSRVANNSNISFTQRLVKAMVSQMDDSGRMGGNNTSFWAECSDNNYVSETEAAGDHNITPNGRTLLNHINSGLSVFTGEYSMGAICQAFPELMNRNLIKEIPNDSGIMGGKGTQYASLKDSSPESVAIAKMLQMVPPIMATCGIVQIGFNVSNQQATLGVDSPYALSILEAPGTGFTRGGSLITFRHGVSPLQQPALVAKFIRQVQEEVCPVITKNNTRTIHTTLKIDLLKDSVVDVSLQGRASRACACPSYASSRTAPVMASSEKEFDKTATATTEMVSSFTQFRQATREGQNSLGAMGGTSSLTSNRTFGTGLKSDMDKGVSDAPANPTLGGNRSF